MHEPKKRKSESKSATPVFSLVRVVGEYAVSSGDKFPMRIEKSQPWAGCTEQTLTVGDLQVRVADSERSDRYAGTLPERVLTISKRRRSFDRSSHEPFYATILTARGIPPKRKPSSGKGLSDLLDELDHASRERSSSLPTPPMVTGDPSAVASLLMSAARAYETSSATLLESIRQVAPQELSAELTNIEMLMRGAS